ncbi:MAG: hypothetical protein K0Q46_3188 [Rhodococcus erythropolis]|jgi:hypothetical protein|nr:hypothetical protein [Rhodococcus erythropolis]
MTGEVCSKGRKSFRGGTVRFVCEYFLLDVSRYCGCRGGQIKRGRFSGVDVLSGGMAFADLVRTTGLYFRSLARRDIDSCARLPVRI